MGVGKGMTGSRAFGGIEMTAGCTVPDVRTNRLDDNPAPPPLDTAATEI